jgi:hypothetical protein
MPNTVQEVVDAVMNIILNHEMPADDKEFEIAKLMGVLEIIGKFGETHETFSDPGALADVSDIDFDIDEAEAAIWEQLETPETLTELHEHAEAEIQAEKDEAKIAKWEAQQ